MQAGLLYSPTPEWTLNSSYVEPCEQYVPPPVILYAGSAAAAIVGVSERTGSSRVWGECGGGMAREGVCRDNAGSNASRMSACLCAVLPTRSETPIL